MTCSILPALVHVVNHCTSGFSRPVSMLACVLPQWTSYECKPLMGSFISVYPKPLHLTQHQDFSSTGCVVTEPGRCFPPLLLGCTGASKAFCSCLLLRIFASICLSLSLRSPPPPPLYSVTLSLVCAIYCFLILNCTVRFSACKFTNIFVIIKKLHITIEKPLKTVFCPLEFSWATFSQVLYQLLPTMSTVSSEANGLVTTHSVQCEFWMHKHVISTWS